MPELIINGSFTGNANGWTLGDGWTYTDNHVEFADEQDDTLLSSSPFKVVEGARYRVSIDMTAETGAIFITCSSLFFGTYDIYDSGVTTFYVQARSTVDDAVLSIRQTQEPAYFVGSIDNVSVRKIPAPFPSHFIPPITY